VELCAGRSTKSGNVGQQQPFPILQI